MAFVSGAFSQETIIKKVKINKPILYCINIVNLHYNYDPKHYNRDLDNKALVWCRIGIKWTNGNYHTCQVQSYNSDGTHTCVYSSGRKRDLHLNRFNFVMISTYQPQSSISHTGPPPTKDELCATTQFIDIIKARPWADVDHPKEPSRYPLL